MSRIGIVVAVLFASTSAYSNCNQSLMIASSKYVQEFEKAQRPDSHRYLPGPCNLLEKEHKKCSDKQKSSLSKKINFESVLGHTCAPHIAPPLPSK